MGRKANIDFNDMVEGFWPTVQNATVCVGQKKKSDIIFPKKGSNMQPGASNFGLPDIVNRSVGMASSEIEAFTRENDVDFNEHKLESFKLKLVGLSSDGVRLAINAKSSKGEQIITTI
jgi:hypothetical protein